MIHFLSQNDSKQKTTHYATENFATPSRYTASQIQILLDAFGYDPTPAVKCYIQLFLSVPLSQT